VDPASSCYGNAFVNPWLKGGHTWGDEGGAFCYRGVYEAAATLALLCQRYSPLPATALGGFSAVMLEPLLALALGILQLRLRRSAPLAAAADGGSGVSPCPEQTGFVRSALYLDGALCGLLSSHAHGRSHASAAAASASAVGTLARLRALEETVERWLPRLGAVVSAKDSALLRPEFRKSPEALLELLVRATASWAGAGAERPEDWSEDWMSAVEHARLRLRGLVELLPVGRDMAQEVYR